jgi:TonB family protein
MEFFIYLIKVNIAIVVLYGFYGLLFRNDTFFQWKRILLLFIPVIALLYPLVDVFRLLNYEITTADQLFPSSYLNEMIIIADQKQPDQVFSFTHYLPAVITGIYGLGVTVLLVRMLSQIGSVCFLLLHTQKMKINGQTIYRKERLQTPFSFFRYIVLDPQQYPACELQEIIRHERTHVRQCHSLDMMMAEIMTVLCWFNPVVWLMKREIRMNLEYLADRSVIDSGSEKERYQFHILRLTYHKAAAKITNNFNVSPLKKRIFMMNKKETPRLGLTKYLLILPVIAALLVFNNCDNNTKKAVAPEIETTDVTVEKAPDTEAVVHSYPIEHVEAETPPAKASEDVFQHVEEMPRFPGGEAALLKWLSNNIDYPESASEQGIQGRVILRFIIRSDGSVDDVMVVKSLHADCDAAAVRAVKTMPKWIPGKQNGIPVAVYYNLPVQFKVKKS